MKNILVDSVFKMEIAASLMAFLILHFIILPHLCSDLPFSIYFNNLQIEKKRQAMEKLLPIGFNNKLNSGHDHSETVLLVMTVTREKNYLNQTLTSILNNVKQT